MTHTTRYWAAGLFRGTAAILAGSGTLFLPAVAGASFSAAARTSLPIVCLASFLVIDASMVTVTAWQAGGSRHQRIVLRLQTILGVAVALALLAMLHLQAPTAWLLSVAAIPALSSAATALATAACPASQVRVSGCYVSAGISLGAAAMLLASAFLLHGASTWAVNLYLCLVGAELIVLSMSMLAEEESALYVESSAR